MKHLKNTHHRTKLTRAAILSLSAATLLGLLGCHSSQGHTDRTHDDGRYNNQHNTRNTDRDHHSDRNHDRPRR